MKKSAVLAFSVGVSLVGCFSAGQAFADGMPERGSAYVSVPTFAGFCIGGHVSHLNSNGGPFTRFNDVDGEGLIISPNSGETIGGVQDGYNFQSGRYVVGVEVDWSWANHTNSVTVAGEDVVSARLNDLGSVRARAGVVAWDRVLFFGTAGWGWARGRSHVADIDEPTFNTHNSDSGLVWGGGAELLLDPRVTVGIQYLHYDFDKSRGPFAIGNDGDSARVKMDDINELRFSVNFKFGDDRRAAPLK